MALRQATDTLQVATRRGLNDVTREVRRAVQGSGIRDGLCTVFIRHTSASLVVQENADPSVLRDLEAFLSRLAPEGDPAYTHAAEGPDDMPGHIKAALTRTSEQIPVREADLALGTWQGLYVWEHRDGRRSRQLEVHVIGE
jgi:secondary thiamine-phosphate synthase enzyme